MFETNDRDDVGRAFDRAFAAGLPLPNGLRRQDNDQMFSFYVASPAGFQVEVGHGACQIGEPWTDARSYDKISAWGHQPVASGRGAVTLRWRPRRIGVSSGQRCPLKGEPSPGQSPR